MTDMPLIAVSIGDAPDRMKLGFPEREVDRVLFAVCAALIRGGYAILYAGNLAPGGYTMKMLSHLAGTYGARGVTPFTNIVPEPVVRALSFDALMAMLRAARSMAGIELAVDGRAHPVRIQDGGLLVRDAEGGHAKLGSQDALAAWLSAFPELSLEQGYTAARHIVTARMQARVAMGGRMGIKALRDADRYAGAAPGIAEEAILALEAGKTYIPLGAFGGATRDVAIALGLLGEDARVPRSEQEPSYAVAMERVARLRPMLHPETVPRLMDVAGSETAEEIAVRILAIVAHRYAGD